VPLAFHSLNHGDIAFGFFNIDTDLLLLEHYFFFADDFCELLVNLAEWSAEPSFETAWQIYDIPRRADIGDLMSAIHGFRFTGFIGEIYGRFPFPQKQEDFKQKPEGFQTRSIVKTILEKYAGITTIPVRLETSNSTIAIAEFLFQKNVFRQLIEYVWLGGYPRWKADIRPDYVLMMKERIEKSRNWPFSGLILV
jgi:hypothetical protein